MGLIQRIFGKGTYDPMDCELVKLHYRITSVPCCENCHTGQEGAAWGITTLHTKNFGKIEAKVCCHVIEAITTISEKVN